MSDENYEVRQGAALRLNVTLKRLVAGVATAITGEYTGLETLATTVWPGSNRAASFAATTTWVSPPAGTITIVITAAQTATLAPGRFELLARLTDSGTVADCYECSIDVLPAAGGIPLTGPASIVSVQEAAANVPGFNPDATGQVQLIFDATDAINTYCGQIFPLSTYDEFHDRQTTREIRVRQYPIVTVDRVCGGLSTGLTITNGTLVRPRITLNPSTLTNDPAATPSTLTLTGYSSGVAVTSTLTLSTYLTLTSLVTAINAIGSGWTAVIGTGTGIGDIPTSDLSPEWGTRPATTAGALLRVYTTDFDYEVNALSGLITIDWSNSLLGGYPYLDWGTSSRSGGVRVSYTAGYSNADMPSALKRACFILIKVLAHRSMVGIRIQDKSGDTFSIFSQGTMKEISELLDPFRRRRIF